MRTLRRSHAVRAALVATVAFPYADAAFAQAASATNPTPIALTARGSYDSNVAGSSAAQAATRGLTQADERLRLNADLNLAKHVGIFDASLIGLVGYNFYAHNTRLNREQIALDAAVLAALARCQVNLTGGWHRQQSELNEISIVAGTGSDTVRNVENTVQYGAEAGCGGKIGLRPAFGVQRSTGTNSATPRRFSDFSRIGYTASLNYAQPAFGKLSLLGSLEDAKYPERPRIAGREDGYLSRSIGVRFERGIGANLVGAVQVDYTNVRPRRLGVQSFSGLTYSADLTATFADRLQLHALASRDTKPSLQSDGAYAVTTTYGLDATFAASRSLSFGVGGVYKKRRYPGAGVLPGTALTDDDRKTVNGNVTLRAGDRLRFELEGLYVTRDSAGTLYDSENTGVALSASFSL